ncbi:beta-lactamase superfamily domain [Klosneuvirus KNV1]|uniref:Beta-lactamase superfamily domain n=1 Tax=Klosneuvirus KNV1 TaxID=1977640 RepID=A0A1V0SJ80_9VIRU|nr:beta-lactamase superfamily domain [Klosneuvirus KNV1]
MALNGEQNALWKVWEERDPITIPGTCYTLRGFSIAALRTNFYVKELGVMLDGGLSAEYSPDHIFITHSHTDHIASLPFHMYATKPNSKIQIYCPEDSCHNIDKMIKSMININNELPNIDNNNPYYDLIPVKEGSFYLTIRNRKFRIEVIKCYHTISCVGYGFIEVRNKLNDEYVKLPQKDIAELRKSGVEISHEVEYPIFCYLGDTSRKILENKEIEKYKNIMIECTFIEKEDLGQADQTLHMHWDYMENYIMSHSEITFILYHFSRRYKRSEIKKFFDNAKLSNIIPWIN